MTVKMIVACDYENGIGRDGEIPWKIPADLKRFKRLTKDSCVVMGRKTFESIGKALPDRLNIVVSNSTKPQFVDGVMRVNSLEDALKMSNHDCWIIGGESLYKEALPITDIIFMTDVYGDFGCDRHFPKLNNEDYYCYADVDANSHIDRKSNVEFRYMVYVRKR